MMLSEIIDLSIEKKIKMDADKYKIFDSVHDEKVKEILEFVSKLKKQLNEI